MRKLLNAWWDVAGPNSPIGPISGIVIFLPSVIVALAIFGAPIIWLVRFTLGTWWHFWLSL